MKKISFFLALLMTTSAFARVRHIDLSQVAKKHHISHLDVDPTRTIYLQDVITRDSVDRLYTEIYSIIRKNHPRQITMFIDSPGGDVFAGIKLVREMQDAQRNGTRFQCIIDGHSMSMAAHIMTFCDTVYMTKGSIIMFHEISTVIEGKVSEILSQGQQLVKLQIECAHDIAVNLGMTDKEFLFHIIGKEWQLREEQAASIGMIDGIVDSIF